MRELGIRILVLTVILISLVVGIAFLVAWSCSYFLERFWKRLKESLGPQGWSDQQ